MINKRYYKSDAPAPGKNGASSPSSSSQGAAELANEGVAASGKRLQAKVLKAPTKIEIKVTDTSGAAIVGAKVTIGGGSKRSGDTDSSGSVLFDKVKAGEYAITCSKVYFRSESLTVTAIAGKTTPAATQLQKIALEVLELTLEGGYELHEWRSPAKLPITGPHWTNAGNPDKPACYLKSSAKVKLAPKIMITPDLPDTVKVTLKAVSAGPKMVFRKKVRISGSEAQLSGIGVESGALDDGVRVARFSLDWSFSMDGGSTWVNMGSTGPNTVYQVAAKPKEKPTYDFALEKVCGYVNGDPDVPGKINKGIPADLSYDPGYSPPVHVLSFYDVTWCLCWDNAKLLRYLCRSVGIPGDLVFIWGGRNHKETYSYVNKLHTVGGTFRVTAPGKDRAPQNPHFLYHVETKVSGVTYDPSYGSEGLIVLDETAPGASRQLGSKDIPSHDEDSGWGCNCIA